MKSVLQILNFIFTLNAKNNSTFVIADRNFKNSIFQFEINENVRVAFTKRPEL